MNKLNEIYYTIRPMAAIPGRREIGTPPVVWFFIAAVFSLIGATASGFELWLLAGFNPENSGGTLIMVFGACVMSGLSLVLGLFWKNRAVFYGLNSVSFLVVVLMMVSLVG